MTRERMSDHPDAVLVRHIDDTSLINGNSGESGKYHFTVKIAAGKVDRGCNYPSAGLAIRGAGSIR
jgi:hypothetical protein